MTYRINIAKGYGKNWNNTGLNYAHYFAIETDMIDTKGTTSHGSDLGDLVREMRKQYPEPAYNISITKTHTHSEVMKFIG
jgi:hypothetical protein|tara:strand:+ start:436 stop:675 length:240 start_codon:yes stop_codon:yes gene_type:complete